MVLGHVPTFWKATHELVAILSLILSSKLLSMLDVLDAEVLIPIFLSRFEGVYMRNISNVIEYTYDRSDREHGRDRNGIKHQNSVHHVKHQLQSVRESLRSLHHRTHCAIRTHDRRADTSLGLVELSGIALTVHDCNVRP
jgi:hypothetical protein